MHPSRGVGAFVTPQVVDGVLAAGHWRSLAPLVPVALLMYAGFANPVYFAEETIGSGRQLGRAILVSLAAVVATQLVPLGAVIIGAGSLQGLMTASSPISAFVEERGGQGLSAAMSLGVALAIVNALVVWINVWARIVFASARDRSWPDAVDRLLGTVHAHFGTPVPATVAIGAAAVAASFLPFDWLVRATAGVGIVPMALVGVSAIQVRRLEHPVGSDYRMPAWPLPPLALILFAVGWLYQSSKDTPSSVAATLAITVVGVVYYYGFIHPRREERWTLPAAIRDGRR
jgi:amino acid transporter